MIYIDEDDIQGLSEALAAALERRGVRFESSGRVAVPSRRTSKPRQVCRRQSYVNSGWSGCGGSSCGVAGHYGSCGRAFGHC